MGPGRGLGHDWRGQEIGGGGGDRGGGGKDNKRYD